MKKIGMVPILLLIVCAAVLCWTAFQIGGVPHHLQYLTDAPAPVTQEENKGDPNGQYAELLQSLRDSQENWANAVTAWTFGAVTESSSVSEARGNSMTVRVDFRGENADVVSPLYLRYGRDFYPEELEEGARVMLLDEQAALGLFSVGDATDRVVEWQGESWRVIGVVRHEKQAGDYTDCGVYVPLMSLKKLDYQPDALIVEAIPESSGALVGFEEGMRAWRAGGTLIDLEKEMMAAGLWLRVLLFLTGLLFAMKVIGLLNDAFLRFCGRWKRRLRREYAIRLLPWIAGSLLLFAAGYLLMTGVLILAFNYVIKPIYVFPEWIPQVLVEPKEIVTAFWNVWQPLARLTEYRTPLLLRLRWLTLVTQWASFGAGAVLAFCLGRWKTPDQTAAEGLRVMTDAGSTVSVWRMRDGTAAERLDYVCLADDRWVRITRVRDMLLSMEATAEDGEFVLKVTDPEIDENNRSFLIRSRGGQLSVTKAHRSPDIALPVDTLTEIICGDQDLADYLESHANLDLRKRSRMMEQFFSCHKTV